MPFFVVWGDLDPPVKQPDKRFTQPRIVLAAEDAFAGREDAEEAIRSMTLDAAEWGQPPPEFRILEAATIEDAMSQVMGIEIPRRSD